MYQRYQNSTKAFKASFQSSPTAGLWLLYSASYQIHICKYPKEYELSSPLAQYNLSTDVANKVAKISVS